MLPVLVVPTTALVGKLEVTILAREIVQLLDMQVVFGLVFAKTLVADLAD